MMHRKSSRSSALLLLLLVFPASVANANPGSLLMIGTLFHLLLGNALIGFFEGLILALLLRLPRIKTIIVIILANYFSAWAGGYLLSIKLSEYVDITIMNVFNWLVFYVIAVYLVTLLLEFPFFWFVIRKKNKALLKTLLSISIVNGISYIFLAGMYWLMSSTSILTQLEVVSVEELIPEDTYVLYYISSDGNAVMRSDLAGNDPQAVKHVTSIRHEYDRLFVRQDDHGKYDLNIVIFEVNPYSKNEQTVLRNFSVLAPIEHHILEYPEREVRDLFFNFGPVPSIAQNSEWNYHTGLWPMEGIYGSNEITNKKFNFAMETPITFWYVRNVTHIQGDLLVFQLGSDQICMLHPESKKIALITRGRAPIVARPASPDDQENSTP